MAEAKFDTTDIYLTHFMVGDLGKFIAWSMDKLPNPHDSYRRARSVLSLPAINPATEGLAAGITDDRVAHKIVQFIMREVGSRISYQQMLSAIDVSIYEGPQTATRITPEQAEEFKDFRYVRDADVPITDDWEAFIARNTDRGHGPGTFQKADKEYVVSRKLQVQRFPTAAEYYGIFGNSGW